MPIEMSPPDAWPAGRRLRHNAKALIKAMKAIGVQKVAMTFSGSGDSGNYDSPSFEMSDGNFMWSGATLPSNPTVSIVVRQGKYDQKAKEFVEKIVLQPTTFDDAVKTTLEDYVEAQHVDWYNNDGGDGEIWLTVDGMFDCDIRQATVHYETAFHCDSLEEA